MKEIKEKGSSLPHSVKINSSLGEKELRYLECAMAAVLIVALIAGKVLFVVSFVVGSMETLGISIAILLSAALLFGIMNRCCSNANKNASRLQGDLAAKQECREERFERGASGQNDDKGASLEELGFSSKLGEVEVADARSCDKMHV